MTTIDLTAPIRAWHFTERRVMTTIDLTAPIRAWHFTERHDVFRDGKPIPRDGRWLVMPGQIVLCQRGLHYSRRAIDALQYAPGHHAHLVDVAGIVEEYGDKGVAAARRIVASINAESLLRDFARACASDVLHLWNAPQVVRDWLATGDESLRFAARDAAGAARTAAGAAASAGDAAEAAGDAARAAQNDRLESMLRAAIGVA